MKLEKISIPKFNPLPKPQMQYVVGGEATGGGTWGFQPPYRKYTSDCIERNSLGQIYYQEMQAEDGTFFSHTVEHLKDK